MTNPLIRNYISCCKNALKLTYSNVEFQNCPGEDPRTPRFQGRGRGEEGEGEREGGRGGDGRVGERRGRGGGEGEGNPLPSVVNYPVSATGYLVLYS